MKVQVQALCLAALGGVATLIAPGHSAAANVGYYIGNNPSYCVAPTDAITQAGHTPVAIAQLDPASLAPLAALVLVTCGSIPADPDLDAAVAAGLALVVDSSDYNAATHPYLPGSPGFSTAFSCPTNINLAAGSPIASGPGGSLSDASFDFGSGYCALTGVVVGSPSPGTTSFLETDDGRVGAFGYTYGSGSVAFSMSSFSRSGVSGMSWWPAARTYLANALAWALAQSAPATTCASEGYTGLKLEWCQNICEKDYTGTQLKIWLRRWTDRYPTLPYCAAEPQPTLQ